MEIAVGYLPFQCPYEQISCPFVDTATSTLDQDCNICSHYLQSIENIKVNDYVRVKFKNIETIGKIISIKWGKYEVLTPNGTHILSINQLEKDDFIQKFIDEILNK